MSRKRCRLETRAEAALWGGRLIDRALAIGLLLAASVASGQEAPPAVDPSVTAPPARIGVSFFTSAPLFAVGVDVEAAWFYGFASTSLAVPLAYPGRIWALSVGAGWTRRFTPSSRWSVDVFGVVTPGFLPNVCSDCSSGTSYFVAAGAGIGIHVTFPNGFTVGFKLPLVGYTYATGQFFASDSPRETAMLTYSYLATAIEQPLVSVGYRW